LIDVTWLGHACFLLRGETKRLMFDPFKGTGLPEPTEKADIILCSHSHSDHNNVKAVRHEKSVVLEGFTGVKQIDNVSIRGVSAFHDTAQGGQRGKNSIYTVRFDDTMFCHLGDLGHELSESQVGEIGAVDVLFILVGGFYTIGPQQARKVMESIRPRITVPMHYKFQECQLHSTRSARWRASYKQMTMSRGLTAQASQLVKQTFRKKRQ